jgi:hypothetical protein
MASTVKSVYLVAFGCCRLDWDQDAPPNDPRVWFFDSSSANTSSLISHPISRRFLSATLQVELTS